jgi:hypothetical protein
MEILPELSLETLNFSCLTVFMDTDNPLSCLPQKALARLRLSIQPRTGT